jgi:phosphoglycerol transferase MdoB-like AlkP superfamily enzyme
MKKLIWPIFWVLVGDFVVCALEFIPAVAQWSNTFVVFLPLVVFALFLLLGIALLVLTVRGKVAGLLRKFLILTGAASIVIPVSFAVLEALPPQVANIIFYIILMAFLVGVVGSIVLARRQRKQATHPS